MTSITPALCRAARNLLGWHQSELAKAARIGLGTVKNFETAKTMPVAYNLQAIAAALEAAGIEFVPEDNGGGVGIRMKKGIPPV